MIKSISLAAGLLALLSNVANAQSDQSTFAFDTGSVVIHCIAPTGEQKISIDIFNEAFALWITKLQVHANEGRVIRAHYLNEFRQGIFIVVAGDTPSNAMENALAIRTENEEILKSAVEKTGGDPSSIDYEESCQLIPIGPVAILPMK